MEFVSKLERTIEGWFGDMPHLPVVARKWIATNIWWIVAIATILNAIAILIWITGFFSNIAILGGAVVSYYVSAAFIAVATVKLGAVLIFAMIQFVLLAMAIRPLREKQKKGWTLLFWVLLISAVSVVMSSLITLSVPSFIADLLFGALGVAIGAYFIFEIRHEFSHLERSAGAKKS